MRCSVLQCVAVSYPHPFTLNCEGKGWGRVGGGRGTGGGGGGALRIKKIVTHSCACHDTFMCVSCCLHVCDMTYSRMHLSRHFAHEAPSCDVNTR